MRSTLAAAFATFLLACFLCAGVAAAAPQGPWLLPAKDLSEDGQDARLGPQIAIAPDGTATAVWTRSDGNNQIVQASTRPPGGSFGNPVDLSATGQSAFDPMIAAGPNGEFTVVWNRFDGSNNIVQSRTRPQGGSFDPIEELSPAGQGSSSPEIAIGPDGTAAATWRCFCGTVPAYVVQASIRPPGGTFGPPQGLSGGGNPADQQQIAVGPGGLVVATWKKEVGPDERIQASVRPAGGSFGVPVTLSAAGEDSFIPRVAIGPDGSTTVVWGASDLDRPIEARTRTVGGSFAAAEELSDPSSETYPARIAIGDDGTTTVAWVREVGGKLVAEATTRPAGAPFSSPETLSEPGQSVGALEIAAGPDGMATAVWGREVSAFYYVLRAATRPSPLADFGLGQVASDTGQSAQTPSVAVGPDGSATAIWQRYNGSNFIIQSSSTQAPEFTLDASKSGTGSGTVTSAPVGIDCGADCDEAYASYTKVTLTADPDPGSSFTGWSGDCQEATGTTCVVNMLGDKSAVATFTADPPTPPDTQVPQVCPAKKLKAGKLRRNRKKGTAVLLLTAGGKGEIILKGSKKVKRVSKKVGSSGKVGIPLRARGKAARVLKRRGRVKIKVRIVFKPGGGCPNKTVKKKIKLVQG